MSDKNKRKTKEKRENGGWAKTKPCNAWLGLDPPELGEARLSFVLTKP
jgi:hypothetical protein